MVFVAAAFWLLAAGAFFAFGGGSLIARPLRLGRV